MQVSWVITWVDNNYDIVQFEYTCVYDGVTYTQKTNGVVGNNSIDTVALENCPVSWFNNAIANRHELDKYIGETGILNIQ